MNDGDFSSLLTGWLRRKQCGRNGKANMRLAEQLIVEPMDKMLKHATNLCWPLRRQIAGQYGTGWDCKALPLYDVWFSDRIWMSVIMMVKRGWGRYMRNNRIMNWSVRGVFVHDMLDLLGKYAVELFEAFGRSVVWYHKTSVRWALQNHRHILSPAQTRHVLSCGRLGWLQQSRVLQEYWQ